MQVLQIGACAVTMASACVLRHATALQMHDSLRVAMRDMACFVYFLEAAQNLHWAVDEGRVRCDTSLWGAVMRSFLYF
jgi:hypothetical protein